ncbi:hypothetical protein B0G84_8107 [Paraburkholderia sp. BL8N3]|nr:hypothetical protein B0G84_8107 [Paraburkholderia sp. BL8N3]
MISIGGPQEDATHHLFKDGRLRVFQMIGKIGIAYYVTELKRSPVAANVRERRMTVQCGDRYQMNGTPGKGLVPLVS